MRASRASSRLRSSTDAATGLTRRPVIIADVVDRQHVRRVGHRQQQRAVVGEADRHRLIALGRLGVEQADRAHVEVVDGQVDVVQAEALGHHAGELVVAQDALLDEHEPGRAALRARDARPPRRPSRGRRSRGRRRLRRSSASSAPRAAAGTGRCPRSLAVRSAARPGSARGRLGCRRGDIAHHRLLSARSARAA